VEEFLATAGGFGAQAPILHVHSISSPHATRNLLLMALLVAVILVWTWWRVSRAP
jgi:hypothetical protein